MFAAMDFWLNRVGFLLGDLSSKKRVTLLFDIEIGLKSR
jgi:hypothetical protein